MKYEIAGYELGVFPQCSGEALPTIRYHVRNINSASSYLTLVGFLFAKLFQRKAVPSILYAMVFLVQYVVCPAGMQQKYSCISKKCDSGFPNCDGGSE